MDRIRLIFAQIASQLGRLNVTQKLLIATLCVVMVMTLFLVSQYASGPVLVELLPSGSADDQQKAVAFLKERGIKYQVKDDGKIAVTQEARYIALAAMAKDQAIPGDKRLVFTDLVGTGSWIEPLADKQQKFNIALQNELAMVITRFPGIDRASVFISSPEAKGLGAAARKPVAQVTVFPLKGQGLDQPTVNALGDLVAGAVAGLDARDISIIDGTNRRAYKPNANDEFSGVGATYIEHVAKVEQRIQSKIEDQLRFIPDVIVGVNAMVDAARRETLNTTVHNKGDGTTVIPVEETSSNDTSSNSSKAPAEPGVGANIAADINRAGGGGGGTSSNNETSSVKSEVRFGEKTVKQRDAAGRPTKINVTVSVPREYVAEIVKTKKSAAGNAAGGGAGAASDSGGAAPADPTDAEIAAEFDSTVKARIEELLAPLVETDTATLAGTAATTGTTLVAGTVKAFLIPVALSASGGSGRSAIGGSGVMGGSGGMSGMGGMGGIAGMLENSLVKTVALGVLALVALGLMFTMVRKAGKSTPLPTAEELVGIPPALEPNSDVVGEADEGSTAMQGIEIDENQLKTNKMLEEIGTLVKSNPQGAAAVFNRWLTPEE